MECAPCPFPTKLFQSPGINFIGMPAPLAWRVAGMQREWRAMVAITRGGLVPAAIICRELGIRMIETVCIASYHDYDEQGELKVLKNVDPKLLENGGEGILVVDDLTDTGKTAAIVRAMMPKAHFATVYAKPKGRPLIDTFVTEVSQDTWIYFPWDMGLTYQEPITKGHGGLRLMSKASRSCGTARTRSGIRERSRRAPSNNRSGESSSGICLKFMP